MLLGVNVDHVATVREARKEAEPDPLTAAGLAVRGGADGITVHLREDRRHINDRDVEAIRKKVGVEMNLEMAATDEMTGIALSVKPDLVTLVPEKRAELTTEGGLDLKKGRSMIRRAIETIQGQGIPVSLFINPEVGDVGMARELGARMIEIHTGLYANARGQEWQRELKRVREAARKGAALGLEVNAGHGLNFSNVGKIAAIREIRGLYIGHSIVAAAIYRGMEEAVREMKRLITKSSR